MFKPRQCQPGYYMTGTGANECTVCSEHKFCPKIRLVYEEACPKGFVCPDPQSFTLREIKECPAGYICPDGTLDLDPTALFKETNMLPCPDGHYCPKGTM